MSEDGAHGVNAENETRRYASILGLPDFVYTVPLISRGQASREVGDALLFSNGLGAVVQVKARSPLATDDGTSWLAKHGAKAVRQANGSRRAIQLAQQASAPLTALPVRVATLAPSERVLAGLTLDHDVSEWPTIVVLEHPNIGGQTPPEEDAFFITLGDWRELLAALRSVAAVITYVKRVLGARPLLHTPLGAEQRRFHALARIDSNVSGGWLSLDTVQDPVGTQCFRELAERVWPNDAPLPSIPIEDYRRVVEYLDSLPPGLMPRVGRWVLRKRQEVEAGAYRSTGLIVFNEDRLLVFAAARVEPGDNLQQFDGMLTCLAIVRSAELATALGRQVECLAIGHRVLEGRGVEYRYLLFKDALIPTQREVSLVAHSFGLYDATSRRIAEISCQEESACPCGSGLLHGECKREFSDP